VVTFRDGAIQPVVPQPLGMDVIRPSLVRNKKRLMVLGGTRTNRVDYYRTPDHHGERDEWSGVARYFL
jgi:hypothetical protein